MTHNGTTLSVALPWSRVLCYVDVTDIIHLQLSCKALAKVVDDERGTVQALWFRAVQLLKWGPESWNARNMTRSEAKRDWKVLYLEEMRNDDICRSQKRNSVAPKQTTAQLKKAMNPNWVNRAEEEEEEDGHVRTTAQMREAVSQWKTDCRAFYKQHKGKHKSKNHHQDRPSEDDFFD